MKYLVQTLAATGLALSMGTVAFAQDADPKTMTCAQFTALAPADQKAALDAIHAAKMEAGGAASSTDATGTASTDTTGTASTDTTATTSTDTGATTSTDTTATADATADPEVTALTEACAGHDDDLAMDHATAAQ